MFPLLLTLAALTGGDSCLGPDCVAGSADVAPPVVALRVLAPAKAEGSGLTTYRVVLTNRSSATAHGVQVRLQLPAETAFEESKPIPPERKDNLLTWNIGPMPGRCERMLSVTLKTKSDGPIEACFRVIFEHGVCVTTQASCKKPPPEERLPLPKASAQLTVVKVAPAKQGLGTPILYSLTVTNSGQLPIRDVELEDIFPFNASYVMGSASDNGQLAGPEGKKLIWKFSALLPHESRTVTFKVRPNANGTYLNVAHAKGVDPDGQSVISKDATSTTEVSGAATIYMEVRDTHDPLFVDQQTEYRILVKNTGSAPATNIRVTADVPVGMTILRIAPREDADASGFKAGEQQVRFPAITLQPGQEKEYRIEVDARKPGLFRFRSTLSSDALDPNKPALVEEETTTVVTEKPPDSQTRLSGEKRFELTSQPK